MKLKSKILIFLLFIVICGMIVPQKFSMPVENGTRRDYNQKSFWFYPWGKSITHKGVDIFAKSGTNVLSSTIGLIIYEGNLKSGGNVVLVLGPKWRLHYYAHLKTIDTKRFSFVKRGEKIGSVGDTGNAAGKPHHLHYSIVTLIPYPWLKDDSRQGWRKMLYLNPIEYLNKAEN